MLYNHFFPLLLVAFLFTMQSCATYGIQQGENMKSITVSSGADDPAYRIFLVGDAGNGDEPQELQTLNLLHSEMKQAGPNSAVIFLGDNVYPNGMPADASKKQEEAELKIDNQLNIAREFVGKTFMIPGNHDWYSGIEGLFAQQKYADAALKKQNTFIPKNGCPTESTSLSEKIKLIAIDSKWYLTDWNKSYGINKNCEIQSREDFFTALEDELKKNQDKTILIAVHHPVISGGEHAGFNSLKSHIFPFNSKVPLPVVGTMLNVLRKTSGINPEDLYSRHYADFAARIRNIIQSNRNVILLSGHEHNLQYLESGNIRQIISGAGSKTDAATIRSKTGFSYGGKGFAVLDVAPDGTSSVQFYSTKDGNLQSLARISVLEKQETVFKTNPAESLPKFATASVYPENLSTKGPVQNFLFGEKYRAYFGIPVKAKVADLSALQGGLKPVREGGGRQTNSLRLINPEKQMFTMKQLSKSAERFLQTRAFRKNTFGEDFRDTFTERLMMDFFTSNHPYLPFAIPHLSETVGVFHTNPELYYVPAQNALGKYSNSYGNQLYMIEEQLSDDPKTLQQFENAQKFEDTEVVIRNLQNPSKYEVDQASYIRARLFDILIGDWDRHQDQWKWAAYQKGGKTVYKPVPKDRDQAFSKFGGKLQPFILSSPPLRHMKGYGTDVKSVRWLNRLAYPLDLIFAKDANADDWKKEASFIQQNLTDAEIIKAFQNLPSEVQDKTSQEVQEKLKNRRNNLSIYAGEYHKILQEKTLITGTDQKDYFEVVRDKEQVSVKHSVISESGTQNLVSERFFDPKLTNEIWIYGLNNIDHYNVTGKNSKITVRLIGGYDNDTYRTENSGGVKIYDFSSEQNNLSETGAARRISDDYGINMYDYRKPMYSFFAGLPMLNYNPDDGVQILLNPSITVNNFIRDPYTQKHVLKLGYYTASGALSAAYKGIFKKVLGSWDFEADAFYSTPNYTQNFFGLSNESGYDKELFKQDYNRVRRSRLFVAPSISHKGWYNFKHQFQAGFESNKIENNDNRIVRHSTDISPDIFNREHFANVNYNFSYENLAQKYFPEFGMGFFLNTGWITSLSNSKQNFFNINGSFNFDHRLDKRARFVLANSSDFSWNSNNSFRFYQAAAVGGDRNLRGYRNFRFTGKSAFANSTDIRWNFGRLKNGIAPMNYGIFAGYDIGRVWVNGEDSRKWHQSYGGGIWLALLETFTARLQYFTGEDGGRISGGLGFGF